MHVTRLLDWRVIIQVRKCPQKKHFWLYQSIIALRFEIPEYFPENIHYFNINYKKFILEMYLKSITIEMSSVGRFAIDNS
jgi:hypothetical protein